MRPAPRTPTVTTGGRSAKKARIWEGASAHPRIQAVGRLPQVLQRALHELERVAVHARAACGSGQRHPETRRDVPPSRPPISPVSRVPRNKGGRHPSHSLCAGMALPAGGSARAPSRATLSSRSSSGGGGGGSRARRASEGAMAEEGPGPPCGEPGQRRARDSAPPRPLSVADLARPPRPRFRRPTREPGARATPRRLRARLSRQPGPAHPCAAHLGPGPCVPPSPGPDPGPAAACGLDHSAHPHRGSATPRAAARRLR